MYKKAIFIFRRDLRLYDNTALNHACHQSKIVIPCFIFDPRQVTEKNKFRSERSVQCMIEGLEDLETQLKSKKGKLYIFNGIPADIVKNLIQKEKADAVFVNADYTPFSIKRDHAIEKVCNDYGIAFHSYHDVLLHDPSTIKKNDGSVYGVFTPFYKKASQIEVSNPQQLIRSAHFYAGSIEGAHHKELYKKILPTRYKDQHVQGGRTAGLKILKHITDFNHYARERDIPSLSTTNLSAYLKFGMLSIREVFHVMAEKLGYSHPLLRQLFWRDFWTYIAYHTPAVYGESYHKKYDKLEWSTDHKAFNAWCHGKTGFPIVDAGMRQLNQTGFMHNRVRMIVASFLTKDLHIDWRWGERYFAQQLIDYDPAVNNGNWQWAASTGCDAQPYFRIFNPWIQQKKFDPDCAYIKKWVPELASVQPKQMHTWYKVCSSYPKNDYVCPIVDHAKESAKAKKLYRNVKT